jgi:hypothetical protein
MLDVCKSYLNNHPHAIWLLVTTFHDHLLLDGTGFQSPDAVCLASVQHRDPTGSQRPVTWLALKPLQLAKPCGMLPTLRPPAELSDEQLDYLVAMSGGHPRSLALLFDQLKSQLDRRPLLDIMQNWANVLATFVAHVPDTVIEECLACSVLGEEVQLTDTLAAWSVQDLVQSTVLINAMDPHLAFVPQLSLLRLGLWAKTHTSATPLKALVRRLVTLGSDLQHRSFEQFHALFEQLRCWAWHRRGRQASTTFKEWFPHAVLVQGPNLSITVPPAQTGQEAVLSPRIA